MQFYVPTLSVCAQHLYKYAATRQNIKNVLFPEGKKGKFSLPFGLFLLFFFFSGLAHERNIDTHIILANCEGHVSCDSQELRAVMGDTNFGAVPKFHIRPVEAVGVVAILSFCDTLLQCVSKGCIAPFTLRDLLSKLSRENLIDFCCFHFILKFNGQPLLINQVLLPRGYYPTLRNERGRQGCLSLPHLNIQNLKKIKKILDLN